MQLEHRHLDIGSIIRRWLWLLILAPVVAGLAAYWLGQQQPIIYEASARLIIGPGIDSPSPDLNSLRAGSQLMQTYAKLATTRPLLQEIINDLGLEMSPLELAEEIRISTNNEAQLMTISVRDTEPDRAIAIANMVAASLIRMSPSGADSTAVQLNIQMWNTAESLEKDIVEIEQSINSLEERFAAATEIEERGLLLDELTRERSRLTDTNNTLANLYDSLSKASTNQVKIVESAAFSTELDGQTRIIVLIGVMAGLVLSLVVAFTFAFFDETIKSPEELAEATNVPVLGAIAGHRSLRGTGQKELAVLALPNSRTAETYRMLGTKMLFSNGNGAASGSRSILLSSGSTQINADVGETTANLAVILAQAGRRVILVDAFLQRPTIGKLFGIDEDRLGTLTDVLTGQSESPRLVQVDWAPGLSILSSGLVSSDAFSMLSSMHMVNLLDDLKKQADIVIIAAAPMLSFADSLILASRVDGVVIVARSGKTKANVVSDVTENLRSLDAHIIGTILDENRLAGRPLPIWRRRRENKPTISIEGASSADTSPAAGDNNLKPVKVL